MELSDVIDILQQFPPLGITGRNDFVKSAVQDKIDASLKRLMEMRELGLLQPADLERLKAWSRGKKS